MGTTEIQVRIGASRSEIYRALLDRDLVARWKVPSDMTSVVHEWNPVEGGMFRVSLTYMDSSAGKSSENTDTYHGIFTRLVEDTEVSDEIEFETSDPDMQGAMTTRITLADVDEGTELTAVHDHLPRGLSLDLNEIGWRESLARLTMILEEPRKSE